MAQSGPSESTTEKNSPGRSTQGPPCVVMSASDGETVEFQQSIDKFLGSLPISSIQETIAHSSSEMVVKWSTIMKLLVQAAKCMSGDKEGQQKVVTMGLISSVLESLRNFLKGDFDGMEAAPESEIPEKPFDAEKWLYYSNLAWIVYAKDAELLKKRMQVRRLDDLKILRWRPTSNFLTNDIAHGVFLDESKQYVIISVRGTSDASTCLMSADFGTRKLLFAGSEIIVHRGIHSVAMKMFKDLLPFLKEMMPKGYKIKVTGHSLGAGVACMLGLLLRGVKGGFSDVQCYLVSPPACIRVPKELAFVKGMLHSVILGDDIVPRLSYMSVTGILNRVRVALRAAREDFGRGVMVVARALFSKSVVHPEQMLPPGSCFHLSEANVTPSPQFKFSKIILSPSCLAHHLIKHYQASIVSMVEAKKGIPKMISMRQDTMSLQESSIEMLTTKAASQNEGFTNEAINSLKKIKRERSASCYASDAPPPSYEAVMAEDERDRNLAKQTPCDSHDESPNQSQETEEKEETAACVAASEESGEESKDTNQTRPRGTGSYVTRLESFLGDEEMCDLLQAIAEKQEDDAETVGRGGETEQKV